MCESPERQGGAYGTPDAYVSDTYYVCDDETDFFLLCKPTNVATSVSAAALITILFCAILSFV